MSPIPEKVVDIATAVRDMDGRALLVGGCVRDLLMKQRAQGLGPRSLWD